MLVAALPSVVLAMLPVAVQFVGYVQLEQPADWYPDLVAPQIAALVVGVEQQSIVAVVDKVAVAVVGPVGHVLVSVLLMLPWDQVVQRLEHVLVADSLELPLPLGGVP